MNPEIIHDALNLLPSDLLQETDRLRSQPRRNTLRWTHFAALAASLVLVVGSVMLLQLRMQKSAPTEAAPESPAMMQAAPAAPAEDVVEEAAAEEEQRDTNAPAAGTHNHSFAEYKDISGTASHSYCGNMAATIHTSSGSVTISGSDAAAITDILIQLNYEPGKLCDCTVDITVDTELLTGIQVNLEEGFARCEEGQAELTQEQIQTIQEILTRLS